MNGTTPTDGTGSRPVTGVSHVAVVTADLDRFRAFYEEVIGLDTAVVMRMNHPPHLRHALLFVDDRTMLHAIEQPGYDPADDGIGNQIGHRGRIDHLGFLVAGVEELEALRDRLVAVHASEGIITPLGPTLSVHFRDPDGLDGEINAVNPAFDQAGDPGDTVEEVADPAWFERILAATGTTGG